MHSRLWYLSVSSYYKAHTPGQFFAQEEYRNTPEARIAQASCQAAEQVGQSPDYNRYDPDIWGSAAHPTSPADHLINTMGSPGSTMEITSRTDDLANNVFPQPGLDSPSAIPKPFGDITAGLQSFAELAADMATTDEIGWEQPARQEPAGNITAGVPALSTLLEEDEEGRTSAYGDENMSVNMDLTAETGRLPMVSQHMKQLCQGLCSLFIVAFWSVFSPTNTVILKQILCKTHYC